jgi:hypothetical protein
MSTYDVDFRLEGDVLHVRLSGEFPSERLDREGSLFQPLVDACVSHNSKKALIDARDLRIGIDALGVFRAGKDAAALTRVGLRVAILAREDMLDPLFDDVAFNRGGVVSIFMDMDTALEWLAQQL